MPKKRLASIRRGIRYQDLVACEAVLDLFGSGSNTPMWVELEKASSGKFDDVVVGYPSKIVHRQVKWAANPGGQPLTLGHFSSTTTKRKTALVKAYSESWSQIKLSGQTFELEFVTNRAPDSEFQGFLSGQSSKIKTNLTKKQREALDATWRKLTSLNKTKFKEFYRSLSFLVNSPGIVKQEEIVRAKLEALGGDDADFLKLLNAIENWSTNEEVSQITTATVEGELNLTRSVPDNTFQLAELIAEREEFNAALCQRIAAIPSGYIIVLGQPGSGKSTAVNTLHKSLSRSSRTNLLVYNCFTGTSDSFLRTRALHSNFVDFVTGRLRSLGLTQQVKVNRDDLEMLLAQASKSLSERREKLVVVIDGMDYAQRMTGSENRLFDSLPAKLPKNVVFIVTAQVAAQLPTELQAISRTSSIPMVVPPLDHAKIKQLVLKSSLSISSLSCDDLTRAISRQSKGHALYVGYALKHLASVASKQDALTLEDAFAGMAPFDDDISNYYSTLIEFSDELLVEALAVQASCPFQLSFKEIGELVEPPANEREIRKAYSKSMHVFEFEGGYLQFTHDSLRVFASCLASDGILSAEKQASFLTGLSHDPRAGEFLLPLLVANRDYTRLAAINFDWIVEQIMFASSTALIHEGLTAAALHYVEQRNWKDAAKFWCLMACLERAQNDGELVESVMIRAWLDLGEFDLVLRYLFLGSRFLSQVFPSDQAVDLLEEYGHTEAANRLRQRIVTQTAPGSIPIGFDDEFMEYFCNLALVTEPAQVVEALILQISKTERDDDDGFAPISRLRERGVYSAAAASRCLDDKQYKKVVDWLDLEETEIEDVEWVKLWFKLRLHRDDLGDYVDEATEHVAFIEDRRLLIELAKTDLIDVSLREQFSRFYLPSLITATDRFFEYGYQMPRYLAELHDDVWLGCKLEATERLKRIKQGIEAFSGPCASCFMQLVFDVATIEVSGGLDWKSSIETFSDRLPVLQLTGNRFENPELEYTMAMAKGIGQILHPLVRIASEQSGSAELEQLIDESLIPSLRESRILYDESLLGLADALIREGVCLTFAGTLLAQVEQNFSEEYCYKSGAFFGLASRYQEVDDMASARRVVESGIRASFSYVFRKDTTINEFIATFDVVAVHLEADQVRATAELIVQAIVILDELTDKAMIFDAASYFVVLLSKYNVSLAVSAACVFERRCRSMKCGHVLQAAHEENVDVTELVKEIRKQLPNAKFRGEDEDVDEGSHPRSHFVTSGGKIEGDEGMIGKVIQSEVASSRFCNAFWNFRRLTEALVDGGRTSEATEVFGEFESGLRILLASYTLPDIEL